MLMHRLLPGLTLLLLALGPWPAAQAGAGICIAKGKNAGGNQTDLQYFLRWGDGSSGHVAGRAAREDHAAAYGKAIPSCRNTARMDKGYFAVIRNERKDYKGFPRVTFALGYAESRAGAVDEAVEELMRRNWSYRRDEAYQVIEVGTFANSDVSSSAASANRPTGGQASGSAGSGQQGAGLPGSGQPGSGQPGSGLPGTGLSGGAADFLDALSRHGHVDPRHPSASGPVVFPGQIPGGAGSRPPTAPATGGALSAADTAQLEQLSQRVMQVSQRVATYGYAEYGNARFCADLQELKCIYGELRSLGWNDPMVRQSLDQVMPLYDQLLDSECGGARACGTYADDSQRRRVDFVDPYENFELNLPGAAVISKPKPKPRPSLSNGGNLAPGTLSDCQYDPSVKYAKNPCRDRRTPQQR